MNWKRSLSIVTGILGIAGIAAGGGSLTRLLLGATGSQKAAFENGLDDFQEIEHFETGLGPTFNDKSCAGCHAQPSVGGASPEHNRTLVFHIGTITNGRFDPLVNLGGEVLQRRSIREEKGSAPIFGETVPKQATLVSIRQTPPLFGAGLLESIRADAILALADPSDRNHDGISGRVNFVRNPETGRVEIGRFGWKADVSTLHVFAGLAYRNEMGITNPTFPEENLLQGQPIPKGWDPIAGLEDDGDTQALTDFMHFLAPLDRKPGNATIKAGEAVFVKIGCASCHVPTLPAGDAPTKALSGKPVPAFTDLLIHDMGSELADGFLAGDAGGAEWRTAPLWGLSRRLFFLHDGRSRSITDAITQHGGEAIGARHAFQDVRIEDRTALLTFLGSL